MVTTSWMAGMDVCLWICCVPLQMVAQGQFRILKVPLGFIKVLQWVSSSDQQLPCFHFKIQCFSFYIQMVFLQFRMQQEVSGVGRRV